MRGAQSTSRFAAQMDQESTSEPVGFRVPSDKKRVIGWFSNVATIHAKVRACVPIPYDFCSGPTHQFQKLTPGEVSIHTMTYKIGFHDKGQTVEDLTRSDVTEPCISPHDVEGLLAVARRMVLLDKAEGDLSSLGMRLLSAPGESGGKDRIADLARLARELGFHVRAVVDNDSPGTDDDLYDELESLTEQLVILPDRTAIERALVYGLDAVALRRGIRGLISGYDLVPSQWGLPEVTDLDQTDAPTLVEAVLRKKLLKKSPGLHVPWVQCLPKGHVPPIAEAVLHELHNGSLGRVVLGDP